MKFAANLSMMFNEVPFMQRFEAAANAGFKHVEFLFPYEFPAGSIKYQLEQHGLTQVLFNTVPGDFAAGERGLAALPSRREEFLDGVSLAIEYAKTLDCLRLHAMAGLVPESGNPADYDAAYLENIQSAAAMCEDAGIELQIEPINNINMPGYYLNDFGKALGIVNALASRNVTVRFQFDLFHCQRIHADIPTWLERCREHTVHFQIAGTPDRHEPDVGDLPLAEAMAAIERLGMQDIVIGCEYVPASGTVDGLGWMKPFLD